MELGERGNLGEFNERPEIEQYGPLGLFEYARAKFNWYQQRQHDMSEASVHLADELDRYLHEYFGEDRPELVIRTKDVTDPFLGEESGRSQRIAGIPRPADQSNTILGEYQFSAKLCGFHVDDEGALRVYVEHGGPLVAKTPAGLLVAFSSVAFEGSEIELQAQKEAGLLNKIGDYIQGHLHEYDPRVKLLLRSLVRVLNEPTEPLHRRLQLSSGIVVELSESGISLQFIDTIMELISLKLKLNSKISLHTDSHRVKIPSETTKAYQQGGPMAFENISVSPEILGGPVHQSLGLSFFLGNDAITVPVHSITKIKRVE